MIAILATVTYFLGVALGLVACGATNYFGLEDVDYYGNPTNKPDKGAAYLVIGTWPVAIPIIIVFCLLLKTGEALIKLGFRFRGKMQDPKI